MLTLIHTSWLWGELLGIPGAAVGDEEAARAGAHAAAQLPAVVRTLAGDGRVLLALDRGHSWRREIDPGHDERHRRWPDAAWKPLRPTVTALGLPTAEPGEYAACTLLPLGEGALSLTGKRGAARDVIATVAAAHMKWWREGWCDGATGKPLVRRLRIVSGRTTLAGLADDAAGIDIVRSVRQHPEHGWTFAVAPAAELAAELGDPRLIPDRKALELVGTWHKAATKAARSALGEETARKLIAAHGSALAVVEMARVIAKGDKLPGITAPAMLALRWAAERGGAEALRALAIHTPRTDVPLPADVLALLDDLGAATALEVTDGRSEAVVERERLGDRGDAGGGDRDPDGRDGVAPRGRGGASAVGGVHDVDPVAGGRESAAGGGAALHSGGADREARAGLPRLGAAVAEPLHGVGVVVTGDAFLDGREAARRADAPSWSDGYGLSACCNRRIVALPGGHWARCEGCGDSSFPVTDDAAEGRVPAYREPTPPRREAPTPSRQETRPMSKPYNFTASDASREAILLRAALCGPTGSGKTKTALILATRMVERLGLGPVFVIDSENKSALRYAYSPRSKQGYRFKHVPMPEDDYSPGAYMAALDFAESQGAGVVVIDSLSHAWNGINGVLEQVDQVTARSRSHNAFSEGWKTMTPVHNRLIQRILGSSAHVLFTMRAKTDWVIQENERGKREPMKVGLAPVQRDGVDYEPDLFFDMTVPDNGLVVSKSRCDRLTPGEVVKRPTVEFADVLIEWIEDSEPPTLARTLGEAVNQAVAEGILAAEEKSAERYKEAKRKLLAWCEQAGVSVARRELALSQFKERVSVVAGPRAESTA